MLVRRRLVILLSLFLSTAGLLAPARADIGVGTITAGTQPGYGMLGLSGFPGAGQSMAVNPVTNKVYVANYGSASVTVIDGATNQTTNIPVGGSPMGVAINSVTNKIYVTNSADNTVSIIDGATGTAAAPVTVGTTPAAIAVNPVTNKVYVANFGAGNVTIIDAANANATTSVTLGGSGPAAIAINALTNRIYVVNYTSPGSSSGMAVIDGTTNAVTAVGNSNLTNTVIVDPVLNRIYCSNTSQNVIRIFDGATNALIGSYGNFNSAGTGSTAAAALALNPVTGTIFTANPDDNSANAFDATVTSYSNQPPIILAGTGPVAVAVNPVTNKAYVVNRGSNDVTVIDGEGGVGPTSVPVGLTPTAVAVNPVTNRIYVANSGAGTVTVIDGVTPQPYLAMVHTGAQYHALTPIAADTTPNDIAINVVTNRIYVASTGGSNVAVIDGSSSVSTGLSPYLTMATTLVPAGTQPSAVAVNPATNLAYVANKASNDITVIDASNTATTLSAASFLSPLDHPGAIAVNPILNRIYVANTAGTTVTVIDGANPSSNTAVTVGTHPAAGGTQGLAVDTSTGKVYVANYDSATVTVIDANNNNDASTSIDVPPGAQPAAIAVNPVTGKVYVANRGTGNNVTIIDTKGGNTTTSVAVAATPVSIAVDVSANKVYVASQSAAGTVVIDGVTNATTVVTGQLNVLPAAVAVNSALNKAVVADGISATAGSAHFLAVDGPSKRGSYNANFTLGSNGIAVAINPVTNKIYIAAQIAESAGGISANVAQVDQNPAPTIPNPLTTSIAPGPALSGNTTHQATPGFTFTASSGFSPNATVPQFVYYQVDSLKGLLRATPAATPGTFTGTTPSLLPGMHILYAFATDGQEAAGGSAFIGKMATYIFFVLQPAAPAAPAIGSAVAGNTSATVSFTPPTDDGGATISTYTATSTPGGLTGTGASPITVSGLTNGTAYTFTVTATNAKGTSLPSDPSNSVTPGLVPPPPVSVVATAFSDSEVEIDFSPVTGASGYKVLRSSMHGGFLPIGTYTTAAPVIQIGLTPNTTYLYEVRALNGVGESADSPMDPATTIVFTDPGATGAVALVVHITQLRTAVNAMRAAAGQVAASFTDPTLVGGTTPIRAVHITELRTALDAARSALLLAGITYTDPTLTAGVSVIRAADILELRNGTQ